MESQHKEQKKFRIVSSFWVMWYIECPEIICVVVLVNQNKNQIQRFVTSNFKIIFEHIIFARPNNKTHHQLTLFKTKFQFAKQYNFNKSLNFRKQKSTEVSRARNCIIQIVHAPLYNKSVFSLLQERIIKFI